MSEQNPSAAEVPQVPSAPRQSLGQESPGGTPEAAAAPAPVAQETLGSAPAAQETLGSAPVAQETLGSAPVAQETLGSAPVPAAGVPAPPTAPAPEAEVKPRRRRGIGLLIPVVLLVVLLVAAGAYYFLVYRTSPANAKVGECLSGTTTTALVADDLKITDCADPSVTFKVVQRVDDKLQSETDKSCGNTNPPTDFYFWTGSEGKKGTVLCLAAVTK